MSCRPRPQPIYTDVMKNITAFAFLILTMSPAGVLGYGRAVVRMTPKAQVRIPGSIIPRVPSLRPGGTLPGPHRGIIIPIKLPSVLKPLPVIVLAAPALAVEPLAVPLGVKLITRHGKAILPMVTRMLSGAEGPKLTARLNAAFDGKAQVKDRGVVVSAPLEPVDIDAAPRKKFEVRKESRVTLPEDDLEAELGL